MSTPRFPSAWPTRVLIVDDHPDITFLLKVLLDNAGFDAHVAIGGREAIELTTGGCRFDFDIVILDVNMPDIDGASVATAIRNCNACDATRIIFHSALDEAQVAARFGDYDEFIQKPSDVPQMIERIKRLAMTPRHKESAP